MPDEITGKHSYRDFIDPSAPMYLSDLDILEALQDKTHVTPHRLAQDRFRESVLRLQLRDLERIGAVTQIGLETYQENSYGSRLLRDPPEKHIENDILDVEGISPDAFQADDWRLRDFGSVNAQVIKQLNKEFYEEPGSTYGEVRENEPGLTKQRISNVIDSDIRRLIREFPTTAPLPEACAHWIRAIVGLHLFPDANHRTATNSLEYLVEQSDGPSDRIITPSIPRFVLHSKYTRTFQSDVRYNTLWAKDELFSVWHRYFTHTLCPGLEERRPHDPPTETLDQVLETAREVLNGIEKDASNDSGS
ncbi:hypothetical protein EXE48_13385 [Halorubrum sp. ASP1]|uniref:hypothetical protein n=1 Tax=Halorubrum sp. ASP1 TaxID=2518114 RepID=UPI0010F5B738|nr:hypothetical protein [Halorubrum sp. ASP1]TKX59769.1 hypothetical protein EXE48_13385 [Halorubrum sp. ASP1]